MAKVNVSLGKHIKNPTYEEFKKLVGYGFKHLPEKRREKEMKEAYKEQFPEAKVSTKKNELKANDSETKSDKRPKDSRKGDKSE